MKIKNQLSEKEELLMELLWSYNEPLTSVELLQHLAPKGWNENSIYRSINSLLNKKLLNVCGMEKYKSQYARKFEPTLTKEEYLAKHLYDRGVKKNSVAKVVLALVKEDGVNTDELISQLESIIEELLKEKGK